MRQIEYVINCIQRSLQRVQNDRFTPAAVSPETTQYILDLAKRHPDDHSEFADFVTFLPHDSLTSEILNQIAPVPKRCLIRTLRIEHEDLQEKLLTHIASYDFSNAREYVDRQREIAKTIHDIMANEHPVVMPNHILSAFQSLGYTDN